MSESLKKLSVETESQDNSDIEITDINNNTNEVHSDNESTITKLTFQNPNLFKPEPQNPLRNHDNNNNNININLSSSQSNNSEEKKRQEELKKVYQLKKLAKTVPIPTNDKEVKMRLRELGHPICLFAENQIDRRERLKKCLMAKILQEGKLPVFRKNELQKEEKISDNEIFYTEGSNELKQIRLEIAKYSIPKSSYRLETSRKKFLEIDRIQESLDYEKYLSVSKDYQFVASQFGDERGCGKSKLSPNGDFYAVAGLSGTSTIFSVPDLKKVVTLKGHTDKVNCITFHPESQSSLPKNAPKLATCSSDSTVRLWTFNKEYPEQKSLTFSGHEDRVNSLEFHPAGRVLASTSNDKTWRLWDLETKKQVLLQDGHTTHVYPISFQEDGALVATGDLAGIGLIWDMRSGRSVMTLQGHVKTMLSIKFAGNGYMIASGSDDNTVKIWDLRRKSCVYTLPAHHKAVSDIAFESKDSKFMISASYDSSFKIWNNRDWSVVNCFKAQGEGKITSISLSNDNNYILTSSADRTIKLWSKINKI